MSGPPTGALPDVLSRNEDGVETVLSPTPTTVLTGGSSVGYNSPPGIRPPDRSPLPRRTSCPEEESSDSTTSHAQSSGEGSKRESCRVSTSSYVLSGGSPQGGTSRLPTYLCLVLQLSPEIQWPGLPSGWTSLRGETSGMEFLPVSVTSFELFSLVHVFLFK